MKLSSPFMNRAISAPTSGIIIIADNRGKDNKINLSKNLQKLN